MVLTSELSLHVLGNVGSSQTESVSRQRNGVHYSEEMIPIRLRPFVTDSFT